MNEPTRSGATPFLYYADVAAALDWLKTAFGCTERFRLTAPNGTVMHAEIEIGGAAVMVGNFGPRNAAPPGGVRSGVYAFVDDVDEHCQRARAAGAEIIEPPADQPYGDRIYLARDLEGHEWYFAQHLRDVSIDDLQRRMDGAALGG
jgi:PhnB protein